MPSSSQPAKTEQVTKVELPKWVDEASRGNYELAKQIASKPLSQYEGARVADQSDLTTKSYDYMTKNLGASDPLYQQAAGILSDTNTNANAAFGKGANYLDAAGSIDVGATVDPYFQGAKGMLDQAAAGPDINKFLNPWTAEVENNAMSNLERQRKSAIGSLADKAASSGAFGGSRQGLTEAVTNSETARQAGDLSASLRQQGWDTATANAFSDVQRMLNTAGGYTSAGGTLGNLALGEQTNLTGIGNAFNNQAGTIGSTGTNIASGLTDVGKTRQAGVLADAGMLSGMGQEEQVNRQKQIDADMAKFYEARDYDTEGLNVRLSALGMSPYGKTESTTKTGTSEQQGTDWATTGLGVMSALPALMGMFSDRRAKTDVEKVGDDPGTGVPLYAYRYKSDPKSYPKVVGPMAQDVEKKYPGSTKKVGTKGMLAIG